MLTTAFFNNSFVNIKDLQIHSTDLAIHRAYGIFDFFKMRDRANPWIGWYFERLFQSLELTRLSIPLDEAALKSTMQELLERNDVYDAYIKIVVTAGYSSNGYSRGKDGNMMLFAMPMPKGDVKSVATSNLITDEYRRDIPMVKTTNYMRSCILQPQMTEAEAIDVLYHMDGMVSEASRSNIFVIQDGVVSTPNKYILQGVTRRRVLSLENPGVKITERDVSLDEVFAADEVFITSSTKGIMPILKIDDKTIGNGTTGPISKALMEHINVF